MCPPSASLPSLQIGDVRQLAFWGIAESRHTEASAAIPIPGGLHHQYIRCRVSINTTVMVANLGIGRFDRFVTRSNGRVTHADTANRISETALHVAVVASLRPVGYVVF